MPALSSKTRHILEFVGAAFGVYLLYLIFSNVDMAQALSTLSRLTIGGAALILLPSCVQALLDAWGWRELLPTQVQRHSLWKVLRVRVASEAVVNSIPLGAVISDPLKAWMLKRFFSISFACGSASVALRTFLLAEAQTLLVVIVSAVGFAWLGSVSASYFHNEVFRWVPLLLGLLGVTMYTVTILFACSGSLTHNLHRWLMKTRIRTFRAWLEKQEIHFRELNEELATFAKERRMVLLAVVVFYLGTWSLEGAETYLILHVLGSHVSFWEAFSIEAICSFIRSVAVILPAGLGAQDMGYVAFLGASGESQALAVALIVLKRLRQLLWIAAGAGLLFTIRRRAHLQPTGLLE